MRRDTDVVAKRKPGGQPGNRNALKAGYWSTRNRATRSDVGKLKRSVRDVLRLARAALKAREAELSSPVHGGGGSREYGERETVGGKWWKSPFRLAREMRASAPPPRAGEIKV